MRPPPQFYELSILATFWIIPKHSDVPSGNSLPLLLPTSLPTSHHPPPTIIRRMGQGEPERDFFISIGHAAQSGAAHMCETWHEVPFEFAP